MKITSVIDVKEWWEVSWKETVSYVDQRDPDYGDRKALFHSLHLAMMGVEEARSRNRKNIILKHCKEM